jgi:hypothetical protein
MVEELKFESVKPLFNVGKLHQEEQAVPARNPFSFASNLKLKINKLKMKFSNENDFTES